MTAREEILARISAATSNATAHTLGLDSDDPASPRRSRSDRLEGPAHAALIDLFVERVEDYRAVVERCTSDQLPERVAAAVEGRSVVVPEGLELTVPGAVVDDGLTALELDRIDAVVTRSVLGIAETGTIVLDHGPGQGRRAITLVPDRHVCIVHAGDVVPDVPDAMPRLDPARPLTWVSGPSATSDIELSRVEGVHGPRQLHVIVVD